VFVLGFRVPTSVCLILVHGVVCVFFLFFVVCWFLRGGAFCCSWLVLSGCLWFFVFVVVWCFKNSIFVVQKDFCGFCCFLFCFFCFGFFCWFVFVWAAAGVRGCGQRIMSRLVVVFLGFCAWFGHQLDRIVPHSE